MTGPCACLSLPRLTLSCSDIPENVVQPVCAMTRSALGRAHAASNKIEFRYLNGNLMFPEIHPLTLVFECNSRKADTSLHLVSSNEWHRHQPFGFTFLPSIGR